MLNVVARYRDAREDESGFTVVELVVAAMILMIVLAMFFSTLTVLMHSEDRSQRLVSNEQNVRFELDQLAREIRASNPLVPLLNITDASAYSNQIEVVLGSTTGTHTVVRWTYDTQKEQMEREVMSDTSSTATVLSRSWFLSHVRNVETGRPVFTYYDAANNDLVAQTLAGGGAGVSGNINDPATCAIRVHIELTSDSNPGPLPFTETQDVEIRNRLPGTYQCTT